MQIMPSTARLIAKKYKMPFHRHKLTTDISYNLKLGRKYLSGLLNQFNGSHILSLAAYNAGPSRVNSWIKRNGDPRSSEVDMIDWIEMIPFKETRNYVQRVTENYNVYREYLSTK
jgi:soluble lytic murein transglycosylase